MRLSECFAILNVGPDSQWNEVRRSYHFLAKKYHPDLHPGKPEMTPRFQKITVAFKTLEVRHKSRSKSKAAWQKLQDQRKRFSRDEKDVKSGDPQVATPLGKSPTPLHTASNFMSPEKPEGGNKGLRASLFEWEKKIFLLDIHKTIFIKERRPSHSNVVRIKKGEESFQVRIPPGPWTRMFIRVPQKGNKSIFSNKRGDLLLNIQVPNRETLTPSPAVYYYKVRIPEKALGTDKVWTLKSATGPIKFTLPKTAGDGQKLILKANRTSTGASCASHIMTLNLV